MLWSKFNLRQLMHNTFLGAVSYGKISVYSIGPWTEA